MRLKMGIFTLIAFILLSALPPQVILAENAKFPVSIKGLEVGDKLELYRIASYSQKSKEYNWDSTVKNWMNNDETGQIYKTITPTKLEGMTDKRQIEFCQAVLVGLKNESDGVANLAGYSVLADGEAEDIEVDIESGYYVVLPKGINRIYEIKWIKIEPENEKPLVIEYGEADYQIPKVESKSDSEGTVLTDDEIKVSGKVVIPSYPNMYATGKRIFNLTYVIPNGLEYDKDDSEKKLKVSLPKEAVSEAIYSGAHIYEDQSGNRLFFGTSNGYYFEMTGAALVSSGTIEDALDKYNELHETEYMLKADEAIEAGTEELEGTEALESTEPDTATNITELTVDDESLYLNQSGGNTIIILSIDTETKEKSFTYEYTVKKNEYANDKGRYDNTVYASYSVSPLDTNLVNIISEAAAIDSYGIKIVVRKGNARSYLMTAEEKYSKLEKLTGATFYIYKYEDEIEGEAETENSIDNDDMSLRDVTVYDEENQKTLVYKYIKSLDVNANGEAAVAGIEPGEYLIVQKKCPEGYSLTNKSILIEEADWSNDAIMEGDGTVDLLWLDYETVYLPGTGKRGIGAFVLIGVLISSVAIYFMGKKNNFRIL